jgi:hypothetical protein
MTYTNTIEPIRMSWPAELVSGPPLMRSSTSRAVPAAAPTTRMATSPIESARMNDDFLSIRPGSATTRATRNSASMAGMIHLGPRLKRGGSRNGNIIAIISVKAIGQRFSPRGAAPSGPTLRAERSGRSLHLPVMTGVRWSCCATPRLGAGRLRGHRTRAVAKGQQIRFPRRTRLHARGARYRLSLQELHGR